MASPMKIYVGNDGVEQNQIGTLSQPYHDLNLALNKTLLLDSNIELFLENYINSYSLTGLYNFSN